MNSDANSLGEIYRTFQPRIANIAAGAIIGAALVIGGFSGAAYLGLRDDPKPLDTSGRIAKYAIIALLGIAAPVGGVALILWMKRLATHRVVVCEQGFTYLYGGIEETCRWNDVEKISEVFTEEELKILKVPGASLHNTDRSFVVKRKDGREFCFNVNSIDSIPLLANCLQDARAKHGIPWEQIQQ
jgi:hypothetical protein